MIHIVADENIPFLKGVLDKAARVTYLPGDRIMNHAIKNADALIVRTRTNCNRPLLKGTQVKFIATATIGFDHIDTDYCDKNNIAWYNAAGCNASGVFQYMASALAWLAVKKHIKFGNITLGIVGVGHVGSRIHTLAKILGMKVILNDPPRERTEGPGLFMPLEAVLESSDLISLHVPYNTSGIDRTHHLINDITISKMVKKPILINTSRGPVLDTTSVIKAVRNGNIRDTVIDVWENEPDVDPELIDISAIATPHIAGYSTEGKANGTAMCVNAISRFFGLGIEDWYPEPLPAPDFPVIRINPSEKSPEEILLEGISASYDIAREDRLFKLDPRRFEQLRNSYPVRREFQAYHIKGGPLPPLQSRIFADLGFTVEQ